MKVQIIGVKHKSGTSRRTGEKYDCDILHVAYLTPSRQRDFTGSEVSQLWVDRASGILACIPSPGDILDIGFNQAGYLEYADPA